MKSFLIHDLEKSYVYITESSLVHDLEKRLLIRNEIVKLLIRDEAIKMLRKHL